MEKARRDKLTLKEKINLIDASRSHPQSATISRLDEEYDDQRDLSSTPETCLDASKWIDYIPEFCCEKINMKHEKLMTSQDSLRVAVVRSSIQTAANFQ